MMSTKDRTAPLQELRATAAPGEPHIRRRIAIPGLFADDGQPVTVEATWQIVEADYDWIAVVPDFDFSSDPMVYGNHPQAVGSLHDIAPDLYDRNDFPKTQRTARDALVSMLARHDLGGWVMAGTSPNTLYVKPPLRVRTDQDKARYLSVIREYCPFKARMWWGAEDIVIRPEKES